MCIRDRNITIKAKNKNYKGGQKMKLNEKQMLDVNGGAVKWGVIAGFGAFASFVIGVIDGWMNPKKCNG